MNSIVENLNKNGSFFKFNGIVECVRAKLITEETIFRLKQLKSDKSQIAGHTIADFSVAALDILGVENYTGNDAAIADLIKSKLNF